MHDFEESAGSWIKESKIRKQHDESTMEVVGTHQKDRAEYLL